MIFVGSVILNMLAVELKADDAGPPVGAASSLPAGRAERMKADATAEGKIKLAWRVFEWQENQVGFAVKRREVTKGARRKEWFSVGAAPIQPNMQEKHLRQAGYEDVLKLHAKWVSAGNPTKPEDLISLFRSKPKDFAKLARVSYHSFDWARGFGLGLVDDSAELGKTYEYNVSRVLESDGRLEIAKPFASVVVCAKRGGTPCPEIVDFEAHRGYRAGVGEVTWRISKEEVESALSMQVSSLAVLKGSPSEPLEKEIVRVPIESVMLSEDGKYCVYRVKDAKLEDAACKYALAPVNEFGTRGLLSEPAILAAVKAPLGKVEGIECESGQDGILVQWTHEMPEAPFAGYQIKRCRLGDKKFKPVNEKLIPRGRRRFVDGNVFELESGRRVQYVVVAISGDYRSNVSSPVSKPILIPLPVPPVVEKFTAQMVIDGGKRFVICRWNEATSKGLAGYRVERRIPEQDQWVPLGSVDAETTTLRWELKPGDRHLVLRVRAVNEQNVIGSASDLVSLSAPPLEPVTLKNVIFWNKRVDGGIVFYWKAAARDDIAGFRLKVDGEVLGDEKELTTYVRQYKTWAVEAGDHTYELSVVDIWGRESKVAENAPSSTTQPIDSQSSNDRDISKARKVVVDKPYFKEKDKIYSRCEYLQWEDGHKVLHGTSTYYRRDGQVQRTQEWRLGQIHGVSRKFSESGALNAVLFKPPTPGASPPHRAVGRTESNYVPANVAMLLRMWSGSECQLPAKAARSVGTSECVADWT